MRNKSILITAIILAILLVVAVAYIAVDKYRESANKKQMSIYQQGMERGYALSVSSLFQQAITCQPVPVTAENRTINLIAMECLQKK